MRTLDVAARLLALGSLLLAVFACPAATFAAAPHALVIAQAGSDLNPGPPHRPCDDAPDGHGDEDLGDDDLPDPLPASPEETSACAGPAAERLPGRKDDGERTAKRRAVDRPPRS